MKKPYISDNQVSIAFYRSDLMNLQYCWFYNSFHTNNHYNRRLFNSLTKTFINNIPQKLAMYLVHEEFYK